jgi:hypothetical protein
MTRQANKLHTISSYIGSTYHTKDLYQIDIMFGLMGVLANSSFQNLGILYQGTLT